VELREGIVYRRILNRPTYFDTNRNQPALLVFWPRPTDDGLVSLLRADRASVEESLTDFGQLKDRTFGLCSLDVSEVLQMIGPAISFWNVPGEAHVQLMGCQNIGVAAFIASVARVVRAPGA
jgi:hypothetical protein